MVSTERAFMMTFWYSAGAEEHKVRNMTPSNPSYEKFIVKLSTIYQPHSPTAPA